MKKIKDCSALEEVSLIVRLSNVQIKKTTTDDPYASMIAFDGEDKIDAKMWKFTPELKEKLVSGEVYVATGRMKEYQGKLQLNIVDIRKVEESDHVDLSIFYEKAKVDQNELMTYIDQYFKKINNVILKNIVSIILKNHLDQFFEHPAAVTMHHNYYGGLAYHTYCMLRLADAYLELYPFVNRDLVYAGVILHDVGKIRELSGPKGTEYTKEGKLLGHISLGANEIYEIAKELNVEKSEEVLNLLHIILSHHGELECGSPKEPMTPEAMLIHFLDLTDSKMAALEPEVEKTKKGEYTSPIASFDRRIFYIPNVE